DSRRRIRKVELRLHNKTVPVCSHAGILGSGNQVLLRAVRGFLDKDARFAGGGAGGGAGVVSGAALWLVRPVAAVSACLFVLLLGATLAAGDGDAGFGYWPQWRGVNRDGISPDTGLRQDWEASPPELVWMAEGLGSGWASVSLVGSSIYTTGDLDQGQGVIAINAADGSVRWAQAVTDGKPDHSYPGGRCTPTVDGDRLYVVTSDEETGGIVCLRADDGSVLWEIGFQETWDGKMMSQWGFSESPLVDGDWVLCTPGARDAMMVALDKTTGAEVWRCPLPDDGELKEGAGYSSIVVSEGGGIKQYVQLVGCGVIGVRARDGRFLWSYEAVANRTANIPTCITRGDYVFSATGYNQGAGLVKLVPDGNGVKAQEEYFLTGRTLQNKHGGMLLIDDYLYLGHGNARGYPICVEFETGEVAWGGRRQRGVGRGEASVVYADGNVIFRSSNGTLALFAASPEGFQLKGTMEPEYQEGKSWAHPVVTGGRLYLREQDKLMCYDLRP
ncbi:MAG: PQQ-binding-like beta-propeller repeat protein, partial [Planctomycetota bacterium]